MSYINKKGTNSSTRKMTSRQQASDVFSYGYVVTNKSMAKMSQRVVERLISCAKKGTLSDKRKVASFVMKTKKYEKDELLKKIFTEISQKYKDRNGGCTRLLRTQNKERFILCLV